MRKKTSLLFFAIVACTLFFMNFQEAPPLVTRQQLMDEAIAQKVKKYTDTRAKRCTEKLLEEAGNRADSIIIARAKNLKVLQDTVNRPTAPGRPNRPDLLTPIDSSAPAPVLEKETLEALDSVSKNQ